MKMPIVPITMSFTSPSAFCVLRFGFGVSRAGIPKNVV